jgi:glycosyltransferase involved in cell wall biosynthesis
MDKYVHNVYVAPGVLYEELPLYYAAANIVVVPTQTIRACSSLAAMEAMASGKPVIAANVGGIPELIVNGVTGILIPPDNPEELRVSLKNILSNPSSIEAIGQKGRLHIEQYFDLNVSNRTIEQLFTALLLGKTQ